MSYRTEYVVPAQTIAARAYDIGLWISGAMTLKVLVVVGSRGVSVLLFHSDGSMYVQDDDITGPSHYDSQSRKAGVKYVRIKVAPARTMLSTLSKAIALSSYTPARAPAWIIANSPLTW